MAWPSGTELSSPSMRHWSPRSRARASRSPLPMRNRALLCAAQRKRRHTYPELLRARRCRLVVFGIETGERWSEEAATSSDFSLRPALPAHLSPCAALKRCSSCLGVILSVAAQRAFAASLLELPAATELGAAGDPPALHELLADARWLQAPANSRLPARPA